MLLSNTLFSHSMRGSLATSNKSRLMWLTSLVRRERLLISKESILPLYRTCLQCQNKMIVSKKSNLIQRRHINRIWYHTHTNTRTWKDILSQRINPGIGDRVLSDLMPSNSLRTATVAAFIILAPKSSPSVKNRKNVYKHQLTYEQQMICKQVLLIVLYVYESTYWVRHEVSWLSRKLRRKELRRFPTSPTH